MPRSTEGAGRDRVRGACTPNECFQKGGRERVTEMFHITIVVMATPLHAFVKTQNWPLGMVNHTVYKSNLNEAGKNLGLLEFEVPVEKW